MAEHSISISLSGKNINISIPGGFSKDFPAPQKFTYSENVYDPDIYDKEYNSKNILSAWWDFGRQGLFFGGVNGTQQLSISINKTTDKNHDVKNIEGIKNILAYDFTQNHKEFDYEVSQITPPSNYDEIKIGEKNLIHFESIVGGNSKSTYAIPLFEKHYLTLSFTYIKNSDDKKWLEKSKTSEAKIIQTLRFE